MEKGKELLFICDCSSCEHQIIVSFDKEDEMAYAFISLNKFGFWKRLKEGIKYIFGHTSKYGHFEEFIFRKEDADKLIKLAARLKGMKG
jgi:hypothetical protein